jgi:hypothetical protein
MLEIVFLPFVILASLPGTTFIPGIIFIVLYFVRRRKIARINRQIVVGTSFVWLIYGIYETRMYYWMKTVIAPIRVDLLLIAPILYLLAIIGTIVLIKKQSVQHSPNNGVEQR